MFYKYNCKSSTYPLDEFIRSTSFKIYYAKHALFEQTQFNKIYAKNLESARRMAWEQNLVEIYKHNLLAAAGHHSYTLRDNHIADLSTRQYIREMVCN